jgi:hypothetical protein
MRSTMMRRAAAAALVAAAAVGSGGFVSGAQAPGPAAIAVVSANRTQVVAQLALGQWSVVGAARACEASAFKLTARQGSLRGTAGITLTPVRSVTAAAERTAIEAAIGPLFASREGEQRVDVRDLSRVPVTVDAVYAARPASTGVLYYFEASKRLHDAGPPADADADGDVDPRGIVRVTVSGWLRGGDPIAAVGTKSELHWDPVDERGQADVPPGLVPLGVAVNGPEPVWVMRRAIGERVSYLLYAVGASTVRLALTVPAVTC